MSQGYGRCLRQESAQTLVWLGHPETRFTFDHVACETISQVWNPIICFCMLLMRQLKVNKFLIWTVLLNLEQEKLFGVAGLPMVDNCMSGYNSCMFAYGQVRNNANSWCLLYFTIAIHWFISFGYPILADRKWKDLHNDGWHSWNEWKAKRTMWDDSSYIWVLIY